LEESGIYGTIILKKKGRGCGWFKEVLYAEVIGFIWLRIGDSDGPL